MTSELEKRFFQCFGIEPREFKYNIGIWNNELNCNEEHIVTIPYIHYKNYSHCPSRDKGFIYPQITDRILLELICIIGSIYICTQDRESLKEHILVQCMNVQMHGGDIKHQVRTLFEEG